MTDIKLPPMPEGVFDSSGALWALIEDWASAYPGLNASVAAKAIDAAIARLMHDHAREAVRLNAQAVPDGMSDYELSELAHCAIQEANSFGIGHELFLRYFKTLRKRLSAPAAPQLSQPLTDEQMWELWNKQGSDEMTQQEAITFARAIEQAHGIGAKND